MWTKPGPLRTITYENRRINHYIALQGNTMKACIASAVPLGIVGHLAVVGCDFEVGTS